MRKRLIKLLIFFIFIITGFNLWGKSDKEQDTMKAERGFLPIPIFFYSPDTGLGGGIAGLYYHYPYDILQHKPNQVTGSIIYTTKEQLELDLNLERYFKGSEYKLFLDLGYFRTPASFFGIGPDTPDDCKETYTQILYKISGSFLWEIYNCLYIGPAYEFSHYDIKEKETNGFLAYGNIIGSKGVTVSGGGIQLIWDKRDNAFYPLKGFYINLTPFFYHKIIGSDENFYKVDFDSRYFFQLVEKNVLAFNSIIKITKGSVPFQLLPKLGGATMMRGFLKGRYIDRNYIAFQGEYRFPLFWKLGGDLFGSLAQVAPEVDEFTTENLKAACGCGVRLTVDKSEHVNIRFDVAFNGSDFNFYFNMLEAF